MPYLSIDNQKIFYNSNRVNAPYTLLLIHGAAGRHLDWPKEVRHLTNARVISIDLPGHYKSALPGRDSVAGYADVIEKMAEMFGVPNIIPTGHSMGSAIALELAVRQPKWLGGLILVGGGAKMAVSPAILDQIYSDFEAVADFFTKFAWSRGTEGVLRGMGRKVMLETDQDVVHGDYLACSTFDLRNRLDEIKVPTLIIGGEKDKYMPMKNSHYLNEKLINSQLVSFDNTGHMIQLEQPDLTAKAMSKFVDELGSN